MKRRKDLHQISKRHHRRLANDHLSLEIKSSPKKEKENGTKIAVDNFETSRKHSVSENDLLDSFLKTSFPKNSSESSLENYGIGSNQDIQTDASIDEEAKQVENSCTFKNLLSLWAIQEQISHSSLSKLLKILKKHGHSDLPSDSRSLLGTPRHTDVKEVSPGYYWHAGLESGLINILSNEDLLEYKFIELAVNVDGLPLAKSSGSSLWPILCAVVPFNRVFLVGAYHGNTKPLNANEFLKDFVDEVKRLSETGILIKGEVLKIQIKYFICDAPAKAFILNVKSHGGYSSCTKCYVEGEYIKNRVCFRNFLARKRSDADFLLKVDEDYHLGPCILENLPNLGLVTNIPLDYMHLVCLGVVRKLVYFWVGGNLNVRLKSSDVKCISQNLHKVKNWVPKEFARKPRSLAFCKVWKATEYRQILLYTGPVVLNKVLPSNLYNNFMTLSVGIRILCSRQNFLILSNYAQQLLEHFVSSFAILYGEHNVSHNVHGLVHLVGDCTNFGILDNFSAFRFENYMQFIKKLIRKSDKPLQQLSRRHKEIEKKMDLRNNLLVPDLLNGDLPHFDGPLIEGCTSPQFKKLQFKDFCIDVSSRKDSCCLLLDSTIVLIKNFAYCSHSKETVLIGMEYQIKEDFFVIPCPSSLVNIFLVSKLSNKLKKWSIKMINSKCVLMPVENNKFVVFPLVHLEK